MNPSKTDNNDVVNRNEPVQEIVDWLMEAVQNQDTSAYGKHDEYSKSQYSKSFGQYSKS